MSYIFSVANQKGGVGKTTTAVNVAAQLAGPKTRVVLVDLDPQANATSSLGIERSAIQKTLYDIMVSKMDLADIVHDTNVENLFVIPSDPRLAQGELEIAAIVDRESRLRDILTQVDADIVIIDCPPALGLLTINAFTASDSVLIPVQAEYFALEGLSQLLQTLQLVRRGLNPKLDILGVALTMYTKRMVLSEQVRQEVEKHFGSKVFNTVIPRNIRLAEAPSFGKTIFEHDKWSKGARAYKALSKEVMERVKQST